MPNAIVNFPPAEYETLLELLDGKMSPSRWVSLVVREHVRRRVPAPVSRRPSGQKVGQAMRATGWVPVATHFEVRKEARRLHLREAALLYRIAHHALLSRVVPKDTTGRPDLSLKRTEETHTKWRERRRKAQEVREERRRIKEAALLEKDDGVQPTKRSIAGPVSQVGIRVSSKLLYKFRAERLREPRMSSSTALEEAMLDWIAKRAVVRAKPLIEPVRPMELTTIELPASEPAAPQTPPTGLQVELVAIGVSGPAEVPCDACKGRGEINGGRGELGDGERTWDPCNACGGKGVIRG
jgi:hypothetical protein